VKLTTRRSFLARAGTLAVIPLLRQEPAQQPGRDQGDAGTLRDPASAGRGRERVDPADNDLEVMAIEKRLQCTCGCTLDIYTCRTTDFTCTYSPELHKEVLALRAAGKGPEEIVAAFVDKYGEKVLMAPKPVGFNWAGYLVPGVLLVLVGGTLFAFLRRRARLQAVVPVPAAEPTLPNVTSDELARLERALKESEQ
jgi:cytochrome c-type biogenesis protein CcmH